MSKGGIVKEEFSEARIALMREVNKNHPELVEFMLTQDLIDWEAQLGEIAAYCLIELDGVYTQDELETLYDMLYWKLKDKNSNIIMPPHKPIIH